MRRHMVVFGVVLGLVVTVIAQVSPANIDALGPRVGDKAIAFELRDQSGVLQTLKSVAGPRGTMLVFFRSADW